MRTAAGITHDPHMQVEEESAIHCAPMKIIRGKSRFIWTDAMCSYHRYHKTNILSYFRFVPRSSNSGDKRNKKATARTNTAFICRFHQKTLSVSLASSFQWFFREQAWKESVDLFALGLKSNLKFSKYFLIIINLSKDKIISKMLV